MSIAVWKFEMARCSCVLSVLFVPLLKSPMNTSLDAQSLAHVYPPISFSTVESVVGVRMVSG